MAEFQTIGLVGDIPEGEGRAFEVAGRMIAVFLVKGRYSAILDACPHMGASLASGQCEEGAVYCPWHAWRFCITTGTWLDNPKSSLRQPTFEVRVTDGQIQVQIPE